MSKNLHWLEIRTTHRSYTWKEIIFEFFEFFSNTSRWTPCSACNMSPAARCHSNIYRRDHAKPVSSSCSDPRDLNPVSFDAQLNGQIFGTIFMSYEWVEVAPWIFEVGRFNFGGTSKVLDPQFEYSRCRFYALAWPEHGAKNLAIPFCVEWDLFQVSRVTRAGASRLRTIEWSGL